jgi:hypothetical protein
MNGGNMDSSEITLHQFFALKEDALSTIESSKRMEALKEKIQKESTAIKWTVALNEITKKVGDLLNISVIDIMVKAWNKYRELLKYTDKEKYPPDVSVLVPLAEHTIKSEHKPYLEILINDKAVSRIDFDINISLVLKGMILKIQDGKIKEIKTGSCKGKGNVKLEDFVIMEKETESFSLPGSIKLGDGVAIAP